LSALILPLREQRSIQLSYTHVAETDPVGRHRQIEFNDIDVLIVEGIFLLKRQFQAHFDLRIWIDCSFETALERAIGRGQEGLDQDATIKAYQTIYFPAQRIHMERDAPKSVCDAIVVNDHRL
jgi:uridine kinase